MTDSRVSGSVLGKVSRLSVRVQLSAARGQLTGKQKVQAALSDSSVVQLSAEHVSICTGSSPGVLLGITV